MKEPKLLRRPGSAKSLSSSSTGGDTDPHTDDGSDVDQHDANEIEDEHQNDDDGEIFPQVAHTKNLLAKFRLMEDSGIPPPSPEHSARVQRSAVQVSVRKTTSAPAVSNGHSVNSDVDECDGRLSEDNMEPDAGEFENEPQHDPDVVRGDERIVEPLPERGSTRSLMAKFQALQSTY